MLQTDKFINSTANAMATALMMMMMMAIIQLNSLANPVIGSHLKCIKNNNNSNNLSKCLATVIKLNIDKHDKLGGGTTINRTQPR